MQYDLHGSILTHRIEWKGLAVNPAKRNYTGYIPKSSQWQSFECGRPMWGAKTKRRKYQLVNHLPDTKNDVTDGSTEGVRPAEGHKHYEINQPSHHHHHLICVKCNKAIEFKNESILKIGSKMTLKEGYQLLDCQLTIHAICPSCQQSLMTD